MFASDPLFSDPRLAVLYDSFDDDRRDLDVYVALIVDELNAHAVLDIGCGTGSLAVLLAQRGVTVTGVDPAAASLDIARAKPGTDTVRWVHGDAVSLSADSPSPQFDVAVMTGNVAQVFVDDDAWNATLNAAAHVLRPGGHLVFETRDPAKQAWRNWVPEKASRERTIDGLGLVKQSTELLSTELPLVSFRHTYDFVNRGDRLSSDSTLRFRTKDEITASLGKAGFAVDDVRDAPDRPGLEFVFIASRLPA